MQARSYISSHIHTYTHTHAHTHAHTRAQTHTLLWFKLEALCRELPPSSPRCIDEALWAWAHVSAQQRADIHGLCTHTHANGHPPPPRPHTHTHTHTYTQTHTYPLEALCVAHAGHLRVVLGHVLASDGPVPLFNLCVCACVCKKGGCVFVHDCFPARLFGIWVCGRE